MKKIIFIFMLALISIPISAQNLDKPGEPYYYYCQILGKKNLAGVIRLTILWDNQEEENDIRDEQGNKIKFANMVDAMNYMSKRGWDYVDASTYDNVYHYVFRKLVKSDEEAKNGLYFKEDFKK